MTMQNTLENGGWLKKLPGAYRIVQPHEKVKAGDYMQIGSSYSRINADDWVLPHYDPSGGPFGTFWRKVRDTESALTTDNAPLFGDGLDHGPLFTEPGGAV
jgi:hypothetical protein